MPHIQQAIHDALIDYTWIYVDTNCGDVGWLLSKDGIAVSEDIRVVGNSPAYQVLADGFSMSGLHNNLDEAKDAAETYFLLRFG